MLKKLLKKVSAVVMTLSIFSLLGCSSIDQNQAEEMESLLQKKYGEEFEVTHIGGRWGTGTNDTVTTYVHPKKKKDVVFKAVMSKDGELIADGYIPGLISQDFNQIVESELSKEGIVSHTNTASVGANSSSETNTKITVKEYVKIYNPEYFAATMIVKEAADITPEKFEQAVQAAYKAGLNKPYQVKIYVIAKNDYEKCLENFKTEPDVTDAWYIDYDVVKKITAVVDGNGFNYLIKKPSAKEGE